MTDADLPAAFAEVEALIRATAGEPVTRARYEQIGRAISTVHLAAGRHPVADLLVDVKPDTDAIENAVLALWYNDGDDPRMLTGELADALITRLHGETPDRDLPDAPLAAYDALDETRPDADPVGDAVQDFFQYKMAEAAWEEIDVDVRAARTALACLPDELADDLRNRVRQAGRSPTCLSE